MNTFYFIFYLVLAASFSRGAMHTLYFNCVYPHARVMINQINTIIKKVLNRGDQVTFCSFQ